MSAAGQKAGHKASSALGSAGSSIKHAADKVRRLQGLAGAVTFALNILTAQLGVIHGGKRCAGLACLLLYIVTAQLWRHLPAQPLWYAVQCCLQEGGINV